MQFNRGRYWFILIAILLIAIVSYFFSDIVTYVLIAWVISLITEPVTKFFLLKLKLKNKKWGPSVSALLTMIVIIVVFLLLLFLLVPPIIEQTAKLANVDFQLVVQKLEEPIQRINGWLESLGVPVTDGKGLENLSEPLKKYFSVGQIGEFFSNLLGTAGSVLFGLFAVLFILFFFLREEDMFRNFLLALTPNEYVDKVDKTITESTQLLTRYFAGILLQITIITLFVTIFLSILNIKNALLIGFFAALINVIPYLGPLIGAIFGIFITISANIDLPFFPEMMNLIIKVGIVFATMQLLDNMILQPFIFSNSVRAHPLEIFIVILLGGKLGGITGMVLAIPTYTLIRVVAKVFLSEFKIVQKMSRNLGPTDGT